MVRAWRNAGRLSLERGSGSLLPGWQPWPAGSSSRALVAGWSGPTRPTRPCSPACRYPTRRSRCSTTPAVPRSVRTPRACSGAPGVRCGAYLAGRSHRRPAPPRPRCARPGVTAPGCAGQRPGQPLGRAALPATARRRCTGGSPRPEVERPHEAEARTRRVGVHCVRSTRPWQSSRLAEQHHLLVGEVAPTVLRS